MQEASRDNPEVELEIYNDERSLEKEKKVEEKRSEFCHANHSRIQNVIKITEIKMISKFYKENLTLFFSLLSISA